VEVEFFQEASGPFMTTVRMADLEPVINDPDIKDMFLYKEDGQTYLMHREHDSLAEDLRIAELGVRAAVAWYVHLGWRDTHGTQA
jgi:hypothetical protein